MGKPPPPAAAPPKRPPPMRLSELSFYTSPHCEYKNCFGDEHICPAYKDPIILPALLPTVKTYRIAISEHLNEAYKEITSNINHAIKIIDDKKEEFIKLARNPEYYAIRCGVVATSGVIGFVAGRRMGTFKDSVLKGLLVSGFALFTTGFLCFPEETDEFIRNNSYKLAERFLTVYNTLANDNIKLKGTICKNELPEICKASKSQNKCPPTECSSH